MCIRDSNSFIGKAIIQAPTSKCFLIVDDATMKEADVSRFGEPLASAADFSELAAQLEVNEAVLQQTVSFYNESAAMGEDRQFGKDPKFLHALEEGPFHAFDAGSENCYTASCGGLKIDLGAHVLDLSLIHIWSSRTSTTRSASWKRPPSA